MNWNEANSYLKNYIVDWGVVDLCVSGTSVLDSNFFISPLNSEEEVLKFLSGYGLEGRDPVAKAELYGHFQEALQIIRRYFLKEGVPDGFDLRIPDNFYLITDVTELFVLATSKGRDHLAKETQLWAEVIVKLMHIILHVDKDLRANYFSIIQTQIFDRFYKYIFRDENDHLFIGKSLEDPMRIQLADFETKAKKTRESVIMKLLHKQENVAEELFDRIGIRFVTQRRCDTVRLLRFLVENHIIVPHSLKPSRSINRLVDVKELKKRQWELFKAAMRGKWPEEKFVEELEVIFTQCYPDMISSVERERNAHMSNSYRSFQFTSRALIKYKNPFLQSFNNIRHMAKEMESSGEESELAKRVLGLDRSLIMRDVRFFYPYEVQIVDQYSHKQNTIGLASHKEYKKAQTKTAAVRVFKKLLIFKGIMSEN